MVVIGYLYSFYFYSIWMHVEFSTKSKAFKISQEINLHHFIFKNGTYYCLNINNQNEGLRLHKIQFHYLMTIWKCCMKLRYIFRQQQYKGQNMIEGETTAKREKRDKREGEERDEREEREKR